MERDFKEALEHHRRDGFLNLKLTDPRSYDYLRRRTWDDRLRMPQFQFSLGKQSVEGLEKQIKEEKDPGKRKKLQAELAQRTREEAEGREAVMTFILGLVADPIPLKHLAQPNQDKLAEIKGRQVLDRFNCAGCHQIRPGMFEFRPSSDALQILNVDLDRQTKNILNTHSFAGHNAWVGTPSPHPDRLVALGTQPQIVDSSELTYLDQQRFKPEELGVGLQIRLSDALRFPNEQKLQRDFPAGQRIWIPLRDLVKEDRAFTSNKEASKITLGDVQPYFTPPFGGTFRDQMLGYIQETYKNEAGNPDAARNLLPPPLVREGERVQPNWLYRFLLKPHMIRPQVKLRMPQFNMSPEEAMSLVNYFTAVERLTNASAGLAEPFVKLKEQEDDYWQRKNEEYIKKLNQPKNKERKEHRIEALKPVWDLAMQDRVVALEPALQEAKEKVKVSQDQAKKDAQKEVEAIQKQIDDLKDRIKKKDYSALRQEWEHKEAYASDAFRLLTYREACMKCHAVGNLGLATAVAPPLDKVSDRLRPEWVQRWVAAPARMFPYDTTMPANISRLETTAYGDKDIFVGSRMEQIMAIRDVMANYPKISQLPVNRFYRPAPGGGK